LLGDQIECSLNGKKHLEAKDDAFSKAGKVGLWSKADAQTSFDDFTATEVGKRPSMHFQRENSMTMNRIAFVLAAGLAFVAVCPVVADESKTMKLIQTIPLEGKPGRFDHLALDANGERLFVANLSNDSLDIVDLKAGKTCQANHRTEEGQGVAFAPTLNRIYQGNGTDGVCNIFDGTTIEKLHTLKTA